MKALDDTRGSVRDSKELVEELRALGAAIKEVERLANESDVQELGSLFDAVGRGAGQCRREMEAFLEDLEGYKKSFSEDGDVNMVKKTVAKVKWQISRKEEVERFRASVTAHAKCISLLLTTINM